MIHLLGCRPLDNIAFLAGGDGAEMGKRLTSTWELENQVTVFYREFDSNSAFFFFLPQSLLFSGFRYRLGDGR